MTYKEYLADLEKEERYYRFRDYCYEQLGEAFNIVTDADLDEVGMARLKKQLNIIFQDILDTVK